VSLPLVCVLVLIVLKQYSIYHLLLILTVLIALVEKYARDEGCIIGYQGEIREGIKLIKNYKISILGS